MCAEPLCSNAINDEAHQEVRGWFPVGTVQPNARAFVEAVHAFEKFAIGLQQLGGSLNL